jgi:formate dehydrogenase alpha subunit
MSTNVVQTICPFCGVGCGMYLVIDHGRVAGAEGWPEHPANRGILCPKGRFSYALVNRPDRLKYPMRRDGDGWKQISWDDAFAIVREHLGPLRDEDPDSIYLFASARCTNEESYLAQKLARAIIGTNNVDNCARLCHAPSGYALTRVFGGGAATNSMEDLEEAGCILVWGYNPFETHPMLFQHVTAARKTGAKLIVVDPRVTQTAKVANLHLQPVPGSDAALLAGIINHVIQAGLTDRKFIERRTQGFEDLASSVEPYTLEVTSSLTGVPVGLIREAAHLYGTSPASSILFGMGLTQHVGSTATIAALCQLAVVTGNVGRPGTGVNPVRGQNNVQGTCDMGALPDMLPGGSLSDPGVRAIVEQEWHAPVPERPGLFATQVWKAAQAGKVKAAYIIGENPVLSEADGASVVRGLEAMEFVVVQDVFMTETARYADLILPASLWAEKDGTFTNTERRVQRVRKVVESPEAANRDWRIIIDMANALGADWYYRRPEDIFEEIRRVAPDYAGITYPLLNKPGFGLQWPVGEGGSVKEILYTERFATPSGKACLAALEPVDLASKLTPEYPFTLITGRLMAQYNTGTMSRRVDQLNRIALSGYVELNREDALQMSVAAGERVRVTSSCGSLETPVKVSSAVPRGFVFMPNHYADTRLNLLVPNITDPVAHTPAYKGVPVRIEKEEVS